MGRLIYSMIMSLDGFVADENGNFDWAEPDEEVHRFVNDLQRSIGTYLYGRRMYETMVYWETEGEDNDVGRDYAEVWRAADKIVYSRTLERTASKKTELRRDFEDEVVRRFKDEWERDIAVAGPELAGQALAAGLVDELQLFVVPALVGGGKRALPGNGLTRLALRDERRFGNGTVYLRYLIDR